MDSAQKRVIEHSNFSSSLTEDTRHGGDDEDDNDNIDLNMLMKPLDNSSDSDSFDYNKIKTESYNFLDDPAFNNDDDDLLSGTYDFGVNAGLPLSTFKIEPSQTIYDVAEDNDSNNSDSDVVETKEISSDSDSDLLPENECNETVKVNATECKGDEENNKSDDEDCSSFVATKEELSYEVYPENDFHIANECYVDLDDASSTDRFYHHPIIDGHSISDHVDLTNDDSLPSLSDQCDESIRNSDGVKLRIINLDEISKSDKSSPKSKDSDNLKADAVTVDDDSDKEFLESIESDHNYYSSRKSNDPNELDELNDHDQNVAEPFKESIEGIFNTLNEKLMEKNGNNDLIKNLLALTSCIVSKKEEVHELVSKVDLIKSMLLKSTGSEKTAANSNMNLLEKSDENVETISGLVHRNVSVCVDTETDNLNSSITTDKENKNSDNSGEIIHNESLQIDGHAAPQLVDPESDAQIDKNNENKLEKTEKDKMSATMTHEQIPTDINAVGQGESSKRRSGDSLSSNDFSEGHSEPMEYWQHGTMESEKSVSVSQQQSQIDGENVSKESESVDEISSNEVNTQKDSNKVVIDEKISEHLNKIESFGGDIQKRKTDLLAEISNFTDSTDIDKIFTDFIVHLEADFKNLTKEYRMVTKLNRPTSIKRDKTAEEKAAALEQARKLNQKSKERWLASSSSSSSDTETENIVIRPSRRKRKRMEINSENSNESVRSVKRKTKKKLKILSDSDLDDSNRLNVDNKEILPENEQQKCDSGGSVDYGTQQTGEVLSEGEGECGKEVKLQHEIHDEKSNYTNDNKSDHHADAASENESELDDGKEKNNFKSIDYNTEVSASERNSMDEEEDKGSDHSNNEHSQSDQENEDKNEPENEPENDLNNDIEFETNVEEKVDEKNNDFTDDEYSLDTPNSPLIFSSQEPNDNADKADISASNENIITEIVQSEDNQPDVVNQTEEVIKNKSTDDESIIQKDSDYGIPDNLMNIDPVGHFNELTVPEETAKILEQMTQQSIVSDDIDLSKYLINSPSSPIVDHVLDHVASDAVSDDIETENDSQILVKNEAIRESLGNEEDSDVCSIPENEPLDSDRESDIDFEGFGSREFISFDDEIKQEDTYARKHSNSEFEDINMSEMHELLNNEMKNNDRADDQMKLKCVIGDDVGNADDNTDDVDDVLNEIDADIKDITSNGNTLENEKIDSDVKNAEPSKPSDDIDNIKDLENVNKTDHRSEMDASGKSDQEDSNGNANDKIDDEKALKEEDSDEILGKLDLPGFSNENIVDSFGIEEGDEAEANDLHLEDEMKNAEEKGLDNKVLNEDMKATNNDMSLKVDKNDKANVDSDDQGNNEDDEKHDEADNEDDEEDVTDKEVDRLCDFSSLTAKRYSSDNRPVNKPRSAKPKKTETLLESFDHTVNNLEIGSNSESEEEILTEQEYLKQCNMNMKQKLLNISDSETDASEDSIDSLVANQDTNAYTVSEGSNDSLMDKFLTKNLKKEMEKMSGESKNDIVQNGEMNNGNSVENPKSTDNVVNGDNIDDVDDNDTEDVKSKEGNEMETSETKDVENGSVKSDNKSKELEDKEDDDEELESAKDEKQKPKNKFDKLDKIVFDKNLFSNLNEYCENSNKFEFDDNVEEEMKVDKLSQDSDCEILDISMFKTNLKKKTMDDEKMATILKNAQKPSIPKAQMQADCISLSSDSDLDLEETIGGEEEENEEVKRRTSRRMLRNDQLTGETKLAQREEVERVKRLEKKNERLSQVLTQSITQNALLESDVVLDHDSKKNENICVHPEIVKHLKPHQIDGVKFMYDTCYGSADSLEKFPGSGCILAHCMGLGKTLQLIALLHTLIRYTQLKTNKILVICPKSTVMNWADEIQRWLGPVRSGPSLKVFLFPDSSDVNDKIKILTDWSSVGKVGHPKAGCLLIGYEAFRTLVSYHLHKKRVATLPQAKLDAIKKKIKETLLKPGADLVICDEGHMIKNRKSGTSLAVNEIKTKRRIILTGTPIQNNLKEYYSMVNFIKPSFLGTEKEFANLYANPIKNGQHKDSSKGEIKFMKQRSYVLHKKLSKFVQRREAALLKTFLPEKFEYVLFIPMTDIQSRLYVYFLENNPLKEKYGGKSLIPDYTFLRKIWTHPKVLEIAWKNAVQLQQKKAKKNQLDSDEDQPDDVLDSQIGKMSVTNDWWREFVAQDDLCSLLSSNKLRILFEILKLCTDNGEKCLIFSAFVAVLNVVEYFLQEIHKQGPFMYQYGLSSFRGPWVLGQDYYRLDGKTPKSVRHSMITKFNDPSNIRTKCFLISAKAGGQGINLIGANRVILLDTSWNPSNDQQNIFRVFRLGQKKKCYIYRLLAMGTMEEKVYSRSVTKQAMSFRVVDEQQIDRHYSMAELAELYSLTQPDYNNRPTPNRPYDNVLASLLHNFPDLVYKYHEHDSLLEQNNEQDLSEQEKADAWAAYEKDVNMQNQFNHMNTGMADNVNFPSSPYLSSMGLPNFPGANMINPYFGLSNVSSQMIQSYLSQMAYQPGFEKEFLMLSQMYGGSPYSGILGSGGATSRSGGGLPTSSLNLSSVYNSLYGQAGSPSGIYNTSNMLPTSTTSFPSTSSISNLYSSSNLGAPPVSSPYSTTTTSQINTTNTGPLSNLAKLLPSFASTTMPTTSLTSSLPTTAISTLAGTSASGTTPPTISPSSSTSAFREVEKNVLGFLSPFYTELNKNPGLSSMSSLQPGPNAMKNPMLSKELSMPSLAPIVSSSKDSFNVPSIPTSVITKNSNISNPTVRDLTKSGNTNGNRNSPVMNPTSPGLNQRNPQNPSQSASTLTIIKGNNSTVSNVMSNPNRNSPAVSVLPSNRNSPNVNIISTKLSSPATISVKGRTSPEHHIIVKNVSAINDSIDQANVSKQTKHTAATPIKNFNMGIVYPKKNDNTSFDLSHNETILKTARNQLNSLGDSGSNVQSSRNQIDLVGSKNSASSISSRLPITVQPIQTKQSKPVAKGSTIGTAPSSTTTASNNSTTLIRRPKDPSSLTSRQSISFPSNLSSDVTISPSPSPSNKKALSQGGLTISPITLNKASTVTYTRVPNPNLNAATSKVHTPASRVLTPEQLKQQQKQAFVLARNILSKTDQVKITPISVQGNASTNTQSLAKKAGTATVVTGGLTRQNTAPIISGNLSTLQAKQASSQGTNVRQMSTGRASTNQTIVRTQQSTPKTVPSTIRQNTVPNIKMANPGQIKVAANNKIKPGSKVQISTIPAAQLKAAQTNVHEKVNEGNRTKAMITTSGNRIVNTSGVQVKSNISMVKAQNVNSKMVTTKPVTYQRPAATAANKTLSGSTSTTLTTPQKRNIADLIPPNSSISIMEVKRPKLMTPSTVSSVTLPTQASPSQAQKRVVRESLIKVNSFDGVTIVPRNSQSSQKSQVQTDCQMEVVELD